MKAALADDVEAFFLFLQHNFSPTKELLDGPLLATSPKILNLFLEQKKPLNKKVIFDAAIEKGNLASVQALIEKEWVFEGIKKAIRLNQKEIYDYLIQLTMA